MVNVRRLLRAWGAAGMLMVAGCGGDEPTEPVDVYPPFNGTWQFRSATSEGQVVCIEHGDVRITHDGGPTFSGEATLILECWTGFDLTRSDTTTVPVLNGSFGKETDRGSWAVTFDLRPQWTYSGEAFISASNELVIQGSGVAVVDPGSGQPFTAPVAWTLCREFVDQADFVERVCR